MTAPRVTNRLLTLIILWGCNNPLSNLDRGTIKVSGLSKPQALIPSVLKSANQGEAIRAGEFQTRQSLHFGIPEDVLAQGDEFSLRRTAPEPSQDISPATPIPTSGSAVTSGDVTLEHLATGGAKISLYLATLINAKSIVYGENTLEFILSSDGTPTYKVNVQFRVKDFTVTGPAMVGMLKPVPSETSKSETGKSETGKSEAWISPMVQTTVTDSPGPDPSSSSSTPSSSPSSFMRTGLMSIIHP